jgi:putative phosphoribosyl transferase
MNELLRYENRIHAGDILAKALIKYRTDDSTIVLASPRGGVPVAQTIARKLNKPLDIFLVKKIGAPGQEELAIGAIASTGEISINKELVKRLDISDAEIQEFIDIKKEELKDGELLLRGNTHPTNIKNKRVILVDDRLATGATMLTAIKAIQKLHPTEVIVAVPVTSHEELATISREINELICPLVPDFFYSIGVWYEDFRQTTDGEVLTLLKNAKHDYECSHQDKGAII